MSSDDSSAARTRLQDTIVTLPLAAIVALAGLLVCGIGGALWTLVEGPRELRETAGSLIVVLSPVLLAVVAAIGIRRTSLKHIDRLVSGFLDVSLKERLEMACRDHGHSDYPFSRVELERESRGRSYVRFRLHWADAKRPPVAVDVKMNVLNIEVVAEMPLHGTGLPEGEVLQTHFIDEHTLAAVPRDPVLRHFYGTVQGSVAEGYLVRAHLRGAGPEQVLMRLSVRQKLRETFLSSPYLKRYFAEDVAIVIGVMFNEWRGSGLAPEGR